MSLTSTILLILFSFLSRQRAYIILLGQVLTRVPGLDEVALTALDDLAESTKQDLKVLDASMMQQNCRVFAEDLRSNLPEDEDALAIAEEIERYIEKRYGIPDKKVEASDLNWLKGALSDLENPPPSPPHE